MSSASYLPNMKRETPKKNGPKTHQELADELGVSRQAITAASQKNDAPKIGDVAAWRAYLAAHGRTGSLPADLRRKIGEARLAILLEQQVAAKRQNDVEAGRMMLTADAVAQAAEAGAMVMSELERLAREIPPAISGLDSISIAKRLNAEVEQIRKTLKEKFNAIGQP
jgi:hypothetical protein